MDHRWGRNVTSYGLGGIGATLAARVLTLPNTFITNEEQPIFGGVWLWHLPLNPDLPYSVTFDGGGGSGLSFPYNYLVEPDGPV